MVHEEDLTRFGTLMAIKNYKEDRIKALTELCEQKDEAIREKN